MKNGIFELKYVSLPHCVFFLVCYSDVEASFVYLKSHFDNAGIVGQLDVVKSGVRSFGVLKQTFLHIGHIHIPLVWRLKHNCAFWVELKWQNVGHNSCIGKTFLLFGFL